MARRRRKAKRRTRKPPDAEAEFRDRAREAQRRRAAMKATARGMNPDGWSFREVHATPEAAERARDERAFELARHGARVEKVGRFGLRWVEPVKKRRKANPHLTKSERRRLASSLESYLIRDGFGPDTARTEVRRWVERPGSLTATPRAGIRRALRDLRASRGNPAFRHQHLQSPARFDRRSFRTKAQGGHRVVVGCPKGQFSKGRCRVPTQAQAVLHPKGEKNPAKCNPAVIAAARCPDGHYWAEFDDGTWRTVSKERGVRLAQVFGRAMSPCPEHQMAMAENRGKRRHRNPMEISRDRWVKTHRDFKTTIKGQPYIMLKGSEGGPALAPVTIIGKKRATKRKANPSPSRPVLIYPQVERVLATKTAGPHQGKYVHDYKAKPAMLGLPNGDVLLTTDKAKIAAAKRP